MRLGLVPSGAMRREQAVLAHHPPHAPRARANAGDAQPRPYLAVAFTVKVKVDDLSADMFRQVRATRDRVRPRVAAKTIDASARDVPHARDARQTIKIEAGSSFGSCATSFPENAFLRMLWRRASAFSISSGPSGCHRTRLLKLCEAVTLWRAPARCPRRLCPSSRFGPAVFWRDWRGISALRRWSSLAEAR